MRRLGADIAVHTCTKQHSSHGDPAATAGSSRTPAAGAPFDMIPLAQRAAMAAAFERTFGIPFPDSVRARISPVRTACMLSTMFLGACSAAA